MNKEKGVACMYSDTLFPSTRLERSGGGVIDRCGRVVGLGNRLNGDGNRLEEAGI